MKEHKTIILDRAGLQKELGLRGIFGKWTASLLYRILEVDEGQNSILKVMHTIWRPLVLALFSLMT